MQMQCHCHIGIHTVFSLGCFQRISNSSTVSTTSKLLDRIGSPQTHSNVLNHELTTHVDCSTSAYTRQLDYTCAIHVTVEPTMTSRNSSRRSRLAQIAAHRRTHSGLATIAQFLSRVLVGFGGYWR
jgi:hypothetical protein